MNHLAVYNKRAFGDDYIALMLEGVKTRDSKFSYRKTAPYERLSPEDVIYLKEASGPVIGRISVGTVVNQELAGPEEVMEFLAPYYQELGIKDEDHLMRVWQSHSNKRYVCQWTMHSPEMLSEPVHIFKRDMRVWIPDYQVPEEILYSF